VSARKSAAGASARRNAFKPRVVAIVAKTDAKIAGKIGVIVVTAVLDSSCGFQAPMSGSARPVCKDRERRDVIPDPAR